MKKLLAGVLGATLGVSATGLTMIAMHEGERFTAYPDPGTGGAPWTICRGHTKGVYPGMVATRKQCDQWFLEDIAVAEKGVRSCTRVPLNQNEYDAYTSFVFNVGAPKFCKSTMVALLNKGHRKEACRQFGRWVYADKRKLNGLVTRRFGEETMCLKYSGVIVYDPLKHKPS